MPIAPNSPEYQIATYGTVLLTHPLPSVTLKENGTASIMLAPLLNKMVSWEDSTSTSLEGWGRFSIPSVIEGNRLHFRGQMWSYDLRLFFALGVNDSVQIKIKIDGKEYVFFEQNATEAIIMKQERNFTIEHKHKAPKKDVVEVELSYHLTRNTPGSHVEIQIDTLDMKHVKA